MDNTLITKSINKAVSYSTYRTLIKGLLVEGKSTGLVQSEDLLNYSALNDKRMDRLDKTIKLNDTTKENLDQLKGKYTFLVIAEGWCGDAAQVLPVIHKIADYSNNITMKVVCRDENEELMNEFLTNGSKSIPKIAIVDEENTVINSWGPRPSIATQMVVDYKNNFGSLDAEFKKDLQIWYNKDKGTNTQEDIIELLVNSEVEVS